MALPLGVRETEGISENNEGGKTDISMEEGKGGGMHASSTMAPSGLQIRDIPISRNQDRDLRGRVT